MASANLFQQYLQPVRSVSDYAADLDKREANQIELLGKRRQNELAALTADQTRQTMADSAADRNALQRLAATWGANTSLEDRVAALRNSGRASLMTQADALEKQGLEKTKTGAQAAKDQAEADAKQAEIKWKLADRHAQQLSFVRTPQDAVAYVDDGIREGSLPAEGRERALTQIQQMGVEKWKAAAAQAAVPVLERYKQEAETLRTKMNNDTSRANTASNNATSVRVAGIHEAGSNSRNKANIAAEDKRASQSVTYQMDANGGLNALPTKIVPGSGAVAPVPVTVNGQQVQGKGSPKAAFTQQYGMVKENLGKVAELLPKATDSGYGALRDNTMNFFGKSTEGADAAAQLDTLGGWLTSTVPRFEGPQSDKDVANYTRMAGDVANRKLPMSQRLKAVQELESLMDAKASGYGLQVQPSRTKPSGTPADVDAILKKHGVK